MYKMNKRYLVLLVLAIFLTACDSLNPPQPTPLPYNRFKVEDVFNAFARAGLAVSGFEQDRTVAREAPRDFQDRYLFEIQRIAPAGGQVIIFATPEQRAAWEAYIEQLLGNSDTRRNVVYTYFHENIMIQLNTGLLTQEASAYRDALLTVR